MSDKKFLILARKRTGSSMLRSALDSHPNVSCLGEIFRVDRPLAERVKGLKIIRRLTGLDDESPEQVDAYIRENAMRFFDDVLAADDQLEALGCKIFIRHHPQFIRDLSRDAGSCIINLRRPNALAAYSSQLIANATGKHNLKVGDGRGAGGSDARVRTKVDFSAEEFTAYRDRISRSDLRMAELLEGASCKMLDIEYMDMLRRDPFGEVLAFLDVDQTVDIKPRTVKGNSSNLLLRFNNPDAVLQYLEKEGLSSWAEEG